jgi:hypothetical protein
VGGVERPTVVLATLLKPTNLAGNWPCWCRYEALLELLRCNLNVEAIEAHEERILEVKRKQG